MAMVQEADEQTRRLIRRFAREGLTVSAIASVVGVSRKTVRKYLVLDPDSVSTRSHQSGYANGDHGPGQPGGLFDDDDRATDTAAV